MSRVVRAFRYIIRLFSGRTKYLAVEVEDVPDILRSGRVYLVGAAGAPWSAALLCPCGCGEIVHLSLIKDDVPSWSSSISASGKVTLWPSINRVRGCRAHFFVRRGCVQWAGTAAE